MDLVDEQNRLRTLAQLIEQRLEALLEITTVFGPGQQGTQVKRIDNAVGKQVRHLIVDDTLGKAFGNGGFTHPGLSDQQRVVLAPTSQNLRHTLDFAFAADQWIDAPLTRQFVQIAGIGIQRIA
ncbi:hypothetical protein ALP75_200346 [Pseudomonas syringae pv. actinidiae]|nr:hypothetical protein ALP75_200346 [Pseudomonas syringae pv. actinidiae]